MSGLTTERPDIGEVESLRASFRWSQVLERLDWDGHGRLNIAHEACVRWAGDRGKVAMLVESVNGDVDTVTYYDLHRASGRLANVLAGLGVRRETTVAALLPRGVEAFIAAIAVWKLGATYVPIYTGFGSDAVRYRLKRSDARVVLTHARQRDLLDDAMSADRPIVTVGEARGRGVRRGDLSFWEELHRADPAMATVETCPTDTAAIVFTSGTTGNPKGCLIPHAGLVGLIPFVDHVMALRKDDLMWATADPSWVFGLMSTGMAPMALGYPRFIYEGDFEPREWWQVIHRHEITHLTGAPTAYRSLVGVGERSLHGKTLALRGATSAGEPLNPEPTRWFRERVGVNIHDAYGLTEVGFALGNLRCPGHVLHPGSAGVELPGYDVALLSSRGKPVEPGEVGTIAVRGHEWFLGSGYLGQEGEWAARWDGEWFVTGDTARRDDDGFYWFVGRSDDVIVTSGVNVGPFEVESALVAHPGVAEAAVVAKPDDRRGNVVVAYVVLASNVAPSDALTAELQNHVREQVGRHAVPREVQFRDQLPRTISGKIRRGELREHAASAST